uniref:Secreted protein n=1 Tax=Heterorhabditis bacteriophora TaxID=37862 RepID=A0A1I7XCZ9_HETBA
MFIPALDKHSITIPLSLTLISLAWWQNFVHIDSVFPPIRSFARYASSFRYFSQFLRYGLLVEFPFTLGLLHCRYYSFLFLLPFF